MERISPSRTMIGPAIHRAAHIFLDGNPKILADTFARACAGFASDADMMLALQSSQILDYPRMRALFTVRSR